MTRNFLAAVFLGLAATTVAHAQPYPSKTVRLLIGNPPGGPSDLSLRGVAQVLSSSMGQPFVVENRPGGDGIIFGEACVRSTPDGHTLCMADSFNIALNPVLRSNMPYDPLKDLSPVVHTGFLPSGFWAPASLPASNLREFLELAKSKPNALNFTSFGSASSSAIYIEWLRNVAGIQVTNIPYKSALNAFQAVVAGESHAAVYAAASGTPFAKAGKVRMLAVNTASRMDEYPGVPTFKESGMGISIITWFGLFAPSATPRNIVQRLNAEVVKGLFEAPAARAKFLAGNGLVVQTPAGESPETFAAFLRAETEMYAGLVKAAKIKQAN
jgi:tripartite-type tricarboxylate transporter receptor subunit TctC